MHEFRSAGASVGSPLPSRGPARVRKATGKLPVCFRRASGGDPGPGTPAARRRWTAIAFNSPTVLAFPTSRAVGTML